MVLDLIFIYVILIVVVIIELIVKVLFIKGYCRLFVMVIGVGFVVLFIYLFGD